MHDSTFIKNQISALSELIPAVVVAVVENEHIEKSYIEVNTIDSLTEHIAYLPKVRGIKRYWRYFEALQSLTESIIKEKGYPKLIHVHVAFKAARIAYLLHKKYEIPYLVTEHFTVFNPKSTQQYKKVIEKYSSYYSKDASYYVAVSQQLGKLLAKKGFKRVTSIYNLINSEVFKPLSKERIPQSFLHISNLASHKNPSSIIRSFAALKKQNSSIQLTIVSNNEKRLEHYKRLAKEEHSNLVIRFEKGKSQQEIAHLMQTHETLVMFSDYETFSLVAAEAACCGMNVIATRCGGPEEFLDPLIHTILRTGDQEGLVKAMEQSLEENKQTLRVKFSKKLRNQLGINSFKYAYSNLYKSVI